MSEHPAESRPCYAITSAEQSAALVPWRYSQAVWEAIDARRVRPFLRLLVSSIVVILIALGGVAAWQFVPLSADGRVETVARGRLYVQDGLKGPWLLADPGRMLRSGARISAEPGTVATLGFADGSMMRIEAQGEWVIDRVAASRNGRVKRVRIKHLGGSASYASAPLQQGVNSHLVVELYGVRLTLRGVATVEQTDEQVHHASLWQGQGRLEGYGQSVDGQPSDRLNASVAARSLWLDVGAVSR